MGKILELTDNRNTNKFTVTGILDEPRDYSHFHFDFLASFSSLRQMMPWIQNWWHPYLYTYALLEEGTTVENFESQLALIPEKIFKEETAKNRTLNAQPITDIHLHSRLENEMEANSNIMYIYLFIAIGFLILLIASINFMNLATSNATKRAKEIGG